MNCAKRRRLRRAWHGPKTEAQIARHERLTPRRVRQIWAEDRAAQLLPDTHRPHFPPQQAKAAPPKASKGKPSPIVVESPNMKLRRDGIAAGVIDLMEVLARAPADMRSEIVEATLATAIVANPDNQSRQFIAADLSLLRVLAIIRRHLSGEQRLPVHGTFYDLSGGNRVYGADEAALHGGRA